MFRPSIKFKLCGIFISFLTLFILIWLLIYGASTQTGKYLDTSKVELMIQADRLRQSLQSVEGHLNDAAQFGDIEELEKAEDMARIFKDALIKIKSINPEMTAELEKISRGFDIYFTNAREAVLILIKKDTVNTQLLQ